MMGINYNYITLTTHVSIVLDRNVFLFFFSKDSEDFAAVRKLCFLRSGVLRAERLSLVSLYLMTLSSSLFCCHSNTKIINMHIIAIMVYVLLDTVLDYL